MYEYVYVNNICLQMRLEKNKHKCVDVYRSHGDFYWLHSALQVSRGYYGYAHECYAVC